ncbi:MAG: NifU N-terminal domain-containing protein [Candidatus Omnitrophica bacterium]|nr:NifU N-terminal domain-containing protein [Candidatus Omnitrophota bacterium]
MAEPLEISMQGTPNPNAAKFTLNRVVATHGKTYRDAASAEVSWAGELLGVAGVTQVFAINNFISITKVPEADWNVIGPHVERILRRAFS